jgi:DNA-binding HxlR family transcriptional regulator
VIRDCAALLTLARKRAALVCGVQTTLSVIEGHWKLPILFRLLDGTQRFGELRRNLPAATQRMLTLHLRELERDGLIHREVYREVPPKVEYSLTDMGRSLEPLLRFMSQWGHTNRGALVAAIQSLATTVADPMAGGRAAGGGSGTRIGTPVERDLPVGKTAARIVSRVGSGRGPG